MPGTTHRDRRRDTPPPRTGNSETGALRGFLGHLRTSTAEKAGGAPEPQVRTAAVPSGTNLLGLLDHLTSVERPMFLGDDVADWEATFRARRRTAWPMSWPATETRSSARTKRSTAAGPPAPGVRWALTHMIEETGRHAGHADIPRELTDGSTGR